MGDKHEGGSMQQEMTVKIEPCISDQYIDCKGVIHKGSDEKIQRITLGGDPSLALKIKEVSFFTSDHKGSEIETYNKEGYSLVSLHPLGKEGRVWIHRGDLFERLHLRLEQVNSAENSSELAKIIREAALKMLMLYKQHRELMTVANLEKQQAATLLFETQNALNMPFTIFKPSEGDWHLKLLRIYPSSVGHFQIFKPEKSFAPKASSFVFREAVKTLEGEKIYKTTKSLPLELPLQRDAKVCEIRNALEISQKVHARGTCVNLESPLISVEAFTINGERLGAVGYLTTYFDHTLVDFCREKRWQFDDATALTMTDQLLCALEYLHALDIYHLDVRSPNIRFSYDQNSEKYLFVLCDFGYASVINDLAKSLPSIQELNTFKVTDSAEQQHLIRVTKNPETVHERIQGWEGFDLHWLGETLKSVMNSKSTTVKTHILYTDMIADYTKRSTLPEARKHLNLLMQSA